MARPLPTLTLLGAALLGAVAPVAAQDTGGTTVTLMRISLPDTLPSAVPQVGLNEFTMRITNGTDGRRVASMMQFEPMAPAMGIPLDAVLMHMIWDSATDSVQLGLTLPPELMESLGGGAGFAFQFVLPDSLPIPAGMGDSLLVSMDNANVSFRDLGTTATVAGLACREYEMASDSMTAKVCLGQRPPGLEVTYRLIDRLPIIGELMAAWREQERELLGQEGLATFRMTGDMGTGSFHMELASYTAGTPDAALFTLAPGLGPVPPEIIAAFMQGAASAAASAAAAGTGTPDAP
jgi:hypothetical protein